VQEAAYETGDELTRRYRCRRRRDVAVRVAFTELVRWDLAEVSVPVKERPLVLRTVGEKAHTLVGSIQVLEALTIFDRLVAYRGRLYPEIVLLDPCREHPVTLILTHFEPIVDLLEGCYVNVSVNSIDYGSRLIWQVVQVSGALIGGDVGVHGSGGEKIVDGGGVVVDGCGEKILEGEVRFK
jgi:hypothetical protein